MGRLGRLCPFLVVEDSAQKELSPLPVSLLLLVYKSMVFVVFTVVYE